MYTGTGSPALGLDNQQAIHCESYVALGTLLIGDIVFYDVASSRVTKSLTAGDYARCLGVVVGGRRTFGTILQDNQDIGEQAAQGGEEVLVAWGGIVKCISDAAIANGDRVAAATATTAGRIKSSALATDFTIGNALNLSGGAAIIIRVLLSISKVPGIVNAT